MKKIILFAAMALLAIVLLGQEQGQPPVQPQEEPQVQAEEPLPLPAEPQGRDLKQVRFPEAFIHAGKEYRAGEYRLVLIAKDGRSMFSVQAAAGNELLFEELAIVKARSGRGTGAGFHVSRQLMKDREYFRVKVTTPGEWLFGYFLIKK